MTTWMFKSVYIREIIRVDNSAKIKEMISKDVQA